jgi:hypothetical protein
MLLGMAEGLQHLPQMRQPELVTRLRTDLSGRIGNLVRRIEVGHDRGRRARTAIGDAMPDDEHRQVAVLGLDQQFDPATPMPGPVDREQRAPDERHAVGQRLFGRGDPIGGRLLPADRHPVALRHVLRVGEPLRDFESMRCGIGYPLLRGRVRRQERSVPHGRIVLEMHASATAGDRSRI